MFHIVLNSDENYIKYAAVLLYSIAKSSADACAKENNPIGGGGVIGKNIFFIS
ncbi:hypothetical protein [Helicobacter sp. MIT 99-10781]|uniref:hypothetical protein n=1 Tax=Helicobacter sp. MIT 99-10781 TaxID=1332285 RepID=UPI0015F27EF1|nr:hypothetical protein [Helicobacter sp. MIT 99-10781]